MSYEIERPKARTQWEHFMLYGVKEGVMGHFADNLDACAEAMGPWGRNDPKSVLASPNHTANLRRPVLSCI